MPRKNTNTRKEARPRSYTASEVQELERRFTKEDVPPAEPVPQGLCIEYAKAALRGLSEVSRDANDEEFHDLCLAFYWLYAAVENSGGASTRAMALISDLLRDYYDSLLKELAEQDGSSRGAPGEQPEDGSGESIIDLLETRRRGGMQVPGSEREDQETLNFMVNARLNAVMGDILNAGADGADPDAPVEMPPFVPEECALLMRFHEPAFLKVDIPQRRRDVLRCSDGSPDFAGQIADDIPPQDSDTFSELSATIIIDFFEIMRGMTDKVLLSGFGVPAEAATMIAMGYLNGRDMAYCLEKAGFWLRYAMALGSPRAWLLHAVFFSKVGRSYLADADGTGYTVYCSDLIQSAKLCYASHLGDGAFFRYGPRVVASYEDGGRQAQLMASAVNSLINADLTLRELQLDRGRSRPELYEEITDLFAKACQSAPADDPALCAAAAGFALMRPDCLDLPEMQKIWDACSGKGRGGKPHKMPAHAEEFSSALIRALIPEHEDLVVITGQGISDSRCKAHRKVLERMGAQGFARPYTLMDSGKGVDARIGYWRKAAELGSPIASCNYAYSLMAGNRPKEAEAPALAAVRGGVPQAFYVLATSYLSQGKAELGCTCMRYAEFYLMPEAAAMVNMLRDKGLYKPLPYMSDLEELEDLAGIDRTACSLFSAIMMCGGVLPRDRVGSLKLMKDCADMGDPDVAGQIAYLSADIWHDVPSYTCVPDLSEGLISMYRYHIGCLGRDTDSGGEKAVQICMRMLKHLYAGKTWLERGIADEIRSGGGWAWLPMLGDPPWAVQPGKHGLLQLAQDYIEILTEERSFICAESTSRESVSESGRALSELLSNPDAQNWRRLVAECGLFTALRGLGGVRLKAARAFAVEGFNCGSEMCGVILGTSLAPVASSLGRSFRDENLLDSDTLAVPEMDQ